MAFHEFLIPVASILVPIAVLFTIRVLDKGEKKKSHIEEKIDEVREFIVENKGKIVTLVSDVTDLDRRVRDVENDLIRLLGRMNGRR